MTLSESSCKDHSQKSTPELIAENEGLREEIFSLKRKLEHLQEPVGRQNVSCKKAVPAHSDCIDSSLGQRKIAWQGKDHDLNKEQVERYSRQILLNCMGVQGLLSLPESPSADSF